MIIVKTPTNTNQKSIACATAIRKDYVCQSVIEPVVDTEFDFCKYERVSYYRVFAQKDDAKTDFDKNDVGTWLISCLYGETVTFRLRKGNIVVSDDCLDVGTVNAYENTQNLFGLQLEWKKVIKLHGVGFYDLEILVGDGTDEGSVKQYSETFKLMEFDEVDADNTFVIESVTTGRILNGYDFTGIISPSFWDLSETSGHYWRYRIDGMFGKRKPKLIRSEYQDGLHNITQIQDKLQNEYTLQTGLIYWPLCKRIIEASLHNSVYLTDFNLFNPELSELKRKSVVISDFNDITYLNNNRKEAISIKLTDRIDNTIKKNRF